MNLVSLNCAGDEFFARQLAFLKSYTPDVICLQEACRQNVAVLMRDLRMTGRFAPMWSARESYTGVDDEVGIAILSRIDIEAIDVMQYAGMPFESSCRDQLDSKDETRVAPKLLVCMKVRDDLERVHTVCTTHFTWSRNGVATQEQRKDLDGLVGALKIYEELILCGDFNAPRGGEIFDTLARLYKDNIPRECRTSIDGALHRAGPLELMVDGLFSAGAFRITDVKLVGDVSDHYAVTAKVS